MNSLDFQNTQVLAHYLYEVEGHPKNASLRNWLEAEKQLHENLFGESKSPRETAKKSFQRYEE